MYMYVYMYIYIYIYMYTHMFVYILYESYDYHIVCIIHMPIYHAKLSMTIALIALARNPTIFIIS